MRLLNKDTLEITYFLDEDAPPYLVLSHRWSGTETSLIEFTAQRHLSNKLSRGTVKAIAFCDHARSYPEEYVWIDTCCIDKTSSAELSETLNSMWKWYQQAEHCIVYLKDVHIDKAHDEANGNAHVQDQLRSSEWFTRGWTLQELLAPRQLTFVDDDWQRIGTREELSDVLFEITKINPSCYGNASKIHAATVAERMSWLSLRKTSRIEDMAYCMLGLMDVNLVPLYGEGPKAFLRLQKEILQTIDDETIFTWQPVPGTVEDDSPIPVLAPEPACFSICRGVTLAQSTYLHREPCRWTVRGLELELYGGRIEQFSAEVLLVMLNCTVNGKRVAFNIQKTAQSGSNVFQRVAAAELLTLEETSYSYPPTAADEFRLKSSRLMVDVMNQRHGMPHPTSTFSSRAVSEFQSERTMFKVFIQ